MSHRKHVTIRHKSLIKFVVCQVSFLSPEHLSAVCKVPIRGRTKVLRCSIILWKPKRKKNPYMYKNKAKLKVLHIWAGSHGRECDKQAVSVLAVCMCVRVCVNVHLETETGNTQTRPYLHTHTEKNGWKNLLRPHPLRAKEIPPDLALHVANWVVAISPETRVASWELHGCFAHHPRHLLLLTTF